MKKKIILLGTCALLLCGCGKIPTLSNGDEAVVEFKGGDKISANDLYAQIKDTYGLNTLIGMVDKYIYEKELSDVVSEAKSYSEAIIKQMRESYSTESDLLNIISYYGYSTVEGYQNALYTSYLQNEAVKKYVSDNITDDELKDYYENNVYPNMTISHILITADVTSDMDSDAQTKAEDDAKATINKIIDELKTAKKNNNVEETFKKLAKEYSEDDSNKDNGGSLGEINLGSLNGEYDELVEQANKLKDGEFSTDLITTEAGYHVILKTKTGEKETYENSIESMKEKITNEKLEDDASLIPDAYKYYREKYELNIIDDELNSQYGKYMNNLINSSRNQD